MSPYNGDYLTALKTLDTKELPRIQAGQYLELWADDRKGGEGLIYVGRFTSKVALAATVDRWKKNSAWRLKYQIGDLDRECHAADYYLGLYR